MSTRIRFALAIATVATLMPTVGAAQAPNPYASILQAYTQAVGHLATALQQSNATAASDALITVLAVHRSLTNALDADRVRIEAASRRVPIGATAMTERVAEAHLERSTLALFAGNWIATRNEQSRQQALVDAPKAVAATQAAVTAIVPLLQTIRGVRLPPALLLDVVVTRHQTGTFILLVDVTNVGGEAADQVKLTLRNGASIGGGPQEIALGTIAPGANIRHAFAVALPPAVREGTTVIEASAGNANTEVFSVDLDSAT